MRLAVERTQDSLRASSNACLESFHTQMETIAKEWQCLAKDIRIEPQSMGPPNMNPSDPAMQRTMAQMQKTIQILEAENEAWEALLEKHRSKAAELARRVEECREGGTTLDPACLSQSSQSKFIHSKPDYHAILQRQLPVLQTIEMVMDSQCKMVTELLNIQQQAQMLVKETSCRLASVVEAEFQDSDPVGKLISMPSSIGTSHAVENKQLIPHMATISIDTRTT